MKDKMIKTVEIVWMLLAGNMYLLIQRNLIGRRGVLFLLGLSTVCFLILHVESVFSQFKSLRLHVLMGGERLLAIVWYSSLMQIVLTVLWLKLGVVEVDILFWVNLVVFVLMESSFLCNGMIRVYCLSKQLTLMTRIGFWFVWLIPLVNIVFFIHMYRVTKEEIEIECEKIELNHVRAENELCKTKYPVLMVHGVFFRDVRFFNYWGRVPQELQRNGATIYYGEQQSAATVADSARELSERIKQIVEETHCGKVNIIAHSKGGLDSRYAISCLGMAPYVASLTTINTPHYGCAFADYLLSKLPEKLCDFVANRYNKTLKRLGDHNPDFMGAVRDLTVEGTARINEVAKDSQLVVYHSYGSMMRGTYSAPFPQSMTYLLSYHFSHDNDGLVDVKSAAWTPDYQVLQAPGRKGISHGDMIDLYRKNIKGFDVREFYVQLVKGLKEEGL